MVTSSNLVNTLRIWSSLASLAMLLVICAVWLAKCDSMVALPNSSFLTATITAALQYTVALALTAFAVFLLASLIF